MIVLSSNNNYYDMKKLHVHTKVKDLKESIDFYTTLYNQEPKVVKEDYAKWDLESPSINFAISPSSGNWGVSHLGIETTSKALRK